MGRISSLDVATIIFNAAGIFMLAGLTGYTAIYRRRGWFTDKLFFSMIISVLVVAVTDTAHHFLDGYPTDTAWFINCTACLIYHIFISVFFGLMAWNMLHKLNEMNGKKTGRGYLVLIPAIIQSAFIIANLFTEIFYSIDRDSNILSEGDCYAGVFAAPYLYIVLILVALVKIDIKAVPVLIVITALRMFFGISQDLCSNVICLSVALVFIHIYRMGRSFYDEKGEFSLSTDHLERRLNDTDS